MLAPNDGHASRCWLRVGCAIKLAARRKNSTGWRKNWFACLFLLSSTGSQLNESPSRRPIGRPSDTRAAGRVRSISCATRAIRHEQTQQPLAYLATKRTATSSSRRPFHCVELSRVSKAFACLCIMSSAIHLAEWNLQNA